MSSGDGQFFTAKEAWSNPESKLHINVLVLKVVLLPTRNLSLFAKDKLSLWPPTTLQSVVAYINKEGV